MSAVRSCPAPYAWTSAHRTHAFATPRSSSPATCATCSAVLAAWPVSSGRRRAPTPEQVESLAIALDHWAGLIEQAAPDVAEDHDLRTGGGTGASGGLGVALLGVCGARLASRFDVLLDGSLVGIDIDSLIARSDLVLTAEGAVDYRTPRGKSPAEIARPRAKRAGKPVVALAGSIGEGAADVHDVGIDSVMGSIPIPMDLAQAVDEAAELVANATERAMRLVLLGCAVADAG